MALLKRNRSFWSAEILPLIRDVGYLKPTLLQQKIIPLILKGKDLAVEAEEGTGKTAAFILPIVVKSQRGKSGIKAVVLTNTLENSRKIYREFRRFLPQGKRKLSPFTFGIVEDVRKENRILLRTPDVLIGTPSRIIDHIRRGNLLFPHLQTVIIDELVKGEKPGFDEDIQFIFSKFPQKRQTILFSPSFNVGTNTLISVLKRPIIIPVTSWRESVPPGKEVFLETDDKQKLSLLFRLILTEDIDSLLILCKNNLELKRIIKALRTKSFRTIYLLENMPLHKQLQVLNVFNEGRTSILVSTFSAIRQKSAKWVSHIICFDLPPDWQEFSTKSFALRKTIFLDTDVQFIQLQEKRKVDIIKNEVIGTIKIRDGLATPQIRQTLRRSEHLHRISTHRTSE